MFRVSKRGISMSKLDIYTDGSVSVNPGGVGTWAWVAYVDGEESEYDYGAIRARQENTNNLMEHRALNEALKWAAHHQYQKFSIYSDSNLAVNQINGVWRIKADSLRGLALDSRGLLVQQQAICAWIPRERNQRADELSKIAHRLPMELKARA